MPTADSGELLRVIGSLILHCQWFGVYESVSNRRNPGEC